ncbi:hypothetical protein OE88DRAFT_1668349 [Heliocybe sulcata]|uniref:YCII-related domain-containing protein n=1 Tax=Heliocybe sulcata TaxID=5364 RepID=A0A5C3MPK0_9AGAM|nr:hypothetical protein OE88DRAFT_1668349 [Heliocybe sulcata]
MSTTSNVFFVYAPDRDDEEASQRRAEARLMHVQRAKELISKGVVKVGGALLNALAAETADKKVVGSAMILQAASMEEIKRLIEEDAYWVANVWDKDRIVILPFLPATPI